MSYEWKQRKGKTYRVTSIEISKSEHEMMESFGIKPVKAYQRGLRMLKMEKTGADINSMEAKNAVIDKLQEMITKLSEKNYLLEKSIKKK